MKSLKILFIAYFYPPAGGPGAQRIIKFLRYLDIKAAWVLTLKPEFYQNWIADSDVHLPIKGEEIIRTGVIDLFGFFFRLKKTIDNSEGKINDRSPRNNEAKTFWEKIKDIVSGLLKFPDFASAWFIPAVSAGYQTVKKNKIDIIFATGMPWTSLLAGAVIKMLRGKTVFIADFRDPWVNNPFILRNRVEDYLDRKAELFVITKANIVLANTEALLEEMQNRYGNMRDKFLYIPNGYDPQDFDGIPNIKLAKDLLTISHTGTLYLKRDPITILNALESLKELPVHFYQIGFYKLSYDVHECCRKKGIEDKVTFIDQLSQKNALGYLAASDVLLLIQPETMTQVPSKLFEYIFFDKPILAIAEKNSVLSKLISKYEFGVVFQPNEYEKVAQYLEILIKERQKGFITGKASYKKEDFDIRKITQKLQNYIYKLG